MDYQALSPIEADRRYEVGETVPHGALPARHAEELVAVGALAAKGVAPDDRSARIQAALDGLADAPDDARTQSGAPNLAWLREAAGLPDLTGAERDREWRLHGEARDAG